MAEDVIKKIERRSAEKGEMATPGAKAISNIDKEHERESGAEGESSKKAHRWEGT